MREWTEEEALLLCHPGVFLGPASPVAVTFPAPDTVAGTSPTDLARQPLAWLEAPAADSELRLLRLWAVGLSAGGPWASLRPAPLPAQPRLVLSSIATFVSYQGPVVRTCTRPRPPHRTLPVPRSPRSQRTRGLCLTFAPVRLEGDTEQALC